MSERTRITKRAVLKLLELLAGREQGLPKLKPSELRRVLLIRYDRIGDMVITTPVLSALKHIAPQVEIDVLASSASAALLKDDSRVSKVFIWEGSLRKRLEVIREARRRDYDAVFQLILGWTTVPALVAGLLTPKGRVIGKSAPRHEALMNHSAPLSSEHFTDRTLEVLGVGVDLDGITLPSFPYSIAISQPERKQALMRIREHGLQSKEFILLNISARADRELTIEQNIQLARALAALGYDVAISGTPEAYEKARIIAEGAGQRVKAVSFGSLLQAIAAMEEARLVVTPDTGVVHMAAAVGTPLVVMFPRTGHLEGWSPRGVPFRVVQAKHGETVQAIDLDEVVEAAAELLEVT